MFQDKPISQPQSQLAPSKKKLRPSLASVQDKLSQLQKELLSRKNNIAVAKQEHQRALQAYKIQKKMLARQCGNLQQELEHAIQRRVVSKNDSEEKMEQIKQLSAQVNRAACRKRVLTERQSQAAKDLSKLAADMENGRQLKLALSKRLASLSETFQENQAKLEKIKQARIGFVQLCSKAEKEMQQKGVQKERAIQVYYARQLQLKKTRVELHHLQEEFAQMGHICSTNQQEVAGFEKAVGAVRQNNQKKTLRMGFLEKQEWQRRCLLQSLAVAGESTFAEARRLQKSLAEEKNRLCMAMALMNSLDQCNRQLNEMLDKYTEADEQIETLVRVKLKLKDKARSEDRPVSPAVRGKGGSLQQIKFRPDFARAGSKEAVEREVRDRRRVDELRRARNRKKSELKQ